MVSSERHTVQIPSVWHRHQDFGGTELGIWKAGDSKKTRNTIKGPCSWGYWIEADRAVDLVIQLHMAVGIVEPKKLIGYLSYSLKTQLDDECDPYDSVDDKRTKLPDQTEIMDQLVKLIDDAIKAGFPINLRDGPIAREPVYEIRLKEGTTPKLVREFNNKQVEDGWVFQNESTRWTCPVILVRELGTGEFRQPMITNL
ncbi:LOW QUALITY PROTEIN: Glycoside hydrolase [Phytophthora palmivora]|uniref:Glycoside hydrolase n=1 Tax=Phytophthora palmivora TaxID=4796 RepID=A0A2P4XGV0_9STRA|nr:LOW QUALITY PROTEIN: Glycoside hydrolase [Phytophthora palmivora]